MESELDMAQQTLAASGEACQTEEEEASRLTNERVLFLVELGASKDELSAFCADVAKEKKAWRRNMILALKPSSIMGTAAAPSRTIFV